MRGSRIAVLHFSNESVRGGAEEHLLTLLRGLDRNTFRFHLVCTPELAWQLRADVPSDVEVLPLSLRKPWEITGAVRLAKILRDRKVDILHSHLFYASLFASPIGWVSRVPVIIETPHVSERWRKGWLKRRFVVDRLIGRFVDYYIAVSEANQRYLVEEKGFQKRKIRVIQNGCDLGRFCSERSAPDGLKRRLGLNENDPVLIVVGRLEPQKGHRVLFGAMRRIRREFPRVCLICVGEGSLREELERQARERGLQEAIRFVGHQSNVEDWLALADVAVLPSFYEGLPLAAIEALAAGRAVVASAVDGTPEVVVDGQTGLTVPPGDSTRLAEAICRLLRHRDLRRALADAGRRWVMARFDRERQIRQTEQLYLEAWAKAKRAAKRPAPFPSVQVERRDQEMPFSEPAA